MARLPSDYLSVAQAVQRYGISRSTLYRLIREGKLKRYRREGDWRVYLRAGELDRLRRPRPQEDGVQ